MKKRGIEFSELEAKILSILIISLSALSVALVLWSIYLYNTKKNVNIRVIEVDRPKPQVDINIPKISLPEKMEATSVINVEKFDYEYLLANMEENVTKGDNYSVFIVDSDNALKIIKNASETYLISRVGEQYAVGIHGTYAYPGLLAQKSLYGIFLLSGPNPDMVFRYIVTLRTAGYPAYSMKFTKGTDAWYALTIGAFPTIEGAEDFYNQIDWENLKDSAGISNKAYIGRVTP